MMWWWVYMIFYYTWKFKWSFPNPIPFKSICVVCVLLKLCEACCNCGVEHCIIIFVLVDFNRILGVIILALNDGKKVNFNNYEWGFLLDLQSQAQCEFVNHVLQLFFSKLRLLLRFNETATSLHPPPPQWSFQLLFSSIQTLVPNPNCKLQVTIICLNYFGFHFSFGLELFRLKFELCFSLCSNLF